MYEFKIESVGREIVGAKTIPKMATVACGPLYSCAFLRRIFGSVLTRASSEKASIGFCTAGSRGFCTCSKGQLFQCMGAGSADCGLQSRNVMNSR